MCEWYQPTITILYCECVYDYDQSQHHASFHVHAYFIWYVAIKIYWLIHWLIRKLTHTLSISDLSFWNMSLLLVMVAWNSSYRSLYMASCQDNSAYTCRIHHLLTYEPKTVRVPYHYISMICPKVNLCYWYLLRMLMLFYNDIFFLNAICFGVQCNSK